MADNYLEKKMEEWREKSTTAPRKTMNLGRLLRKNRSYRGYDSSFEVRRDQLLSIVEVNRLVASARNQQPLRFRLVHKIEADKVLPHIRLGGALPELHLPFPGTEPTAFIIICAEPKASLDNHFTYIDLGISVQSMLLRATELGLGGIIVGAFDKEAIRQAFQLPSEPLLILAIGRPIEKIELIDITSDQSRAYYRKNDIHYVPKLTLDELLIDRDIW